MTNNPDNKPKEEREWRWEKYVPVCKCKKPHLHAEDVEEFGEKVESLIAKAEKRGAMKVVEEMEKMIEEADSSNSSEYVGCMIGLELLLSAYKESLMI